MKRIRISLRLLPFNGVASAAHGGCAGGGGDCACGKRYGAYHYSYATDHA
jgi:hypothetical protein